MAILRNLTIAVATLLAASYASAQASYGYGMAGCGLGTQVFRAKPGKGPQIVQVTINRFASQTSAITTGSSGCKESPRDVAAVYISINHMALMKDVSRGNGETVTNLSKLYQCQNDGAFADTLQKNYKSIFVEGTSAQETSKKIEEVIINNKVGCAALS